MKKTNKIILLIFIIMACQPVDAMLFRNLARQKTPNRPMQRKAPQSPAFYSAKTAPTQTPTSTPATKQATSLTDRLSAWKNKFLNWYQSAPVFSQPKAEFLPVQAVTLPTPLPPSNIAAAPIAPMITKSKAQLESEEILAKLDKPNKTFIGSTIDTYLAKQIEDFLVKNNQDDIEAVFFDMISFNPWSDERSKILNQIMKNNNRIAEKFFPFIKKYLLQGYRMRFARSTDSSTIVDILLHISSDFWRHIDDDLKELICTRYSLLNGSIELTSADVTSISEILPKDKIKKLAILTYWAYSLHNNYNGAERIFRLTLLLREFVIAHQINITENSLKELFTQSKEDKYIITYGISVLLEPAQFLEIVLDLKHNIYFETPSYQHLKKFYHYFSSLSYSISEILESVFRDMVKNCLNKEKESMHKYENFYHARRWQYNFLSDLYSMIYEHQSKKPLKDFIFTHLVEQGTKKSEQFFKSEEERRERLLREGNPFPGDNKLPDHRFTSTDKQLRGFGARQSLLFLNKFLFGNLGNSGSCSMSYVLSNMNIGKIEFSLKEIFNMFGYGNAYETYAKELDELQKEHAQLSTYGEMLQILVPKDNVDKCVYYTTSGGPKIPFKKWVLFNTTNTKGIIKSLNQNPKNIAEFGLINTQDKFGGLNPDSGIKIFSHNLVDPEKMAAFKAKEKQLFDRIKESLKQYDQEKKEKEGNQKREALARE